MKHFTNTRTHKIGKNKAVEQTILKSIRANVYEKNLLFESIYQMKGRSSRACKNY